MKSLITEKGLNLVRMQHGGFAKQLHEQLQTKQERFVFLFIWLKQLINLFVFNDNYLQDLGREPSPEEIAEEMDLTPEKVREILKIAQEPVSLETPIGEEDDSHLGDFIEDQDALSPSEHAAYELLKEQLEDVLDTLTDREENVLRLRFGLR